MKIEIKKGHTIADVQHAFNERYPHLKLVMFTKLHEAYKGSNAKFMITKTEQDIESILLHPKEGFLYIEADMPVWQVERLFEQEFGLHVQVFRQSGNVWLETSKTDDLTLEQQEAKGKSSLERPVLPIQEPMDYREMD